MKRNGSNHNTVILRILAFMHNRNMTSARSLCSLVVAVFWTLLPVRAQESAAISATNFLRINEEFCTAGQPSLEDLTKLKEQGVKSILNLRRAHEDPILAEEAKKAEALGLKYFNIPVDGSNLQETQADEFLKIVSKEENRPMLIHCGSANRVGGFWIIYRVMRDKWSFEKAEEEARRIGLRTPALLIFARSYIEKHSQGGPKK